MFEKWTNDNCVILKINRQLCRNEDLVEVHIEEVCLKIFLQIYFACVPLEPTL